MHVFDEGGAERGPAGGPAPAGATHATSTADPAAGVLAMLGAVGPTLADTLQHLAGLAATLAPQADGIALVVLRPDGGDERALTGCAATPERLQAELAEGPALDATRGGAVVGSADLAADDRWPGLAARVAAAGPRSALCVPLVRHGGVLGHVGAYADAADAFGDRERHLAARWAGAAAEACSEALLAEQERRTRLLELDGDERAAVDRAVAALAAQDGVGPDEALAVLEMLARTEQEDLVAVARAVATDVAGGP
ncbi:ANTAR domain-containing protein [Friedmanniella luteola]|uniref:ANTAR domain-containing protein n=1 Tax=Friedmanniella luteola TaxID=546871 RepID=A0A1H1QTX4_9ACTN|nr:GAF domain-containing protein [Friedmanniella luteola]SDS26914.1 ANTAR domain-containing protein [Friedmanniella luteola]